MNLFTRYFLTFTIFSLLISCERDDYGISKPKDIQVFDVTFTDETAYFNESEMEELLKVDTTEYRYYFDTRSNKASELERGDILLLHGLALRKVSSVSEVNDQIVVNTEYATMNEAIEDGVIEWDHEINFEDMSNTPELLIAGESHQFKSLSDDSFSVSMKIGSYDYKITLTYKGDKADVLQEIERKVGEVGGVKFYCQGIIEKFRTSNKIKYANSSVSVFENANDGLKGELVVGLTSAGSGADNLNFEFPATLIKFPFMVGPVPIMVSVKVQFVAKAVVPPEGSSQVAAKFTYNSSTGFGWSPGQGITANGNEGSFKMKKEKAQTGAASAIAINFGLGFPRLEIALFGETIVPWIQTAYLVGGDFTFNPACQQAKAAFIGACGYKLSFLGLLSVEGSKTLWNIEEVLLQSGDCDSKPGGFEEIQRMLE